MDKIDAACELVRAIMNILEEGLKGLPPNLHAALDERQSKVLASTLTE